MWHLVLFAGEKIDELANFVEISPKHIKVVVSKGVLFNKKEILLENYLLPFQFSQLPLLQVVPQNTPTEHTQRMRFWETKNPSPSTLFSKLCTTANLKLCTTAMEDCPSLYEICRNSLGTRKSMES
jgi:hypothetical protein